MVSIFLIPTPEQGGQMECVQAIKKFTEDYELVILKSAEPSELNSAMANSSPENHKLVMLDNIIVTENWLLYMLQALQSDSKIGAVDCDCAVSLSENSDNKALWVRVLQFENSMILIKNEAYKQTGCFDKELNDFYYIFSDYGLRMHKQGYFLINCKNVNVFCKNADTAFWFANTFGVKFFNKAGERFEAKWNFGLLYSSGRRAHIVDMISRHPKASFNVLDIGCACGGTLLEIKHRFKNANIYGVELNSSCAEIASQFATVSNCNIEESGFKDYPDEFFDYIIFGDVLEHLIDPWKVISETRRILKPLGKIVASIPNVSHFSVLKSIMSGDFHYESSGILDKTHLRFFSSHNLNELFEANGYSIKSLRGNIIPFSDEDLLFIDGLCSIMPDSPSELFKVFQYILLCEKRA